MRRQPSSTRVQSKFAQVPKADVQRSRIDRSHGLKTTFGFKRGQQPWNPTGNGLTPIFCDEVLPGDTFDLRATMFARLATPLHPIMDNLYVDTHFFFVPNRLVWDDWQHFMGERDDPDDDPNDFSVPQVPINRFDDQEGRSDGVHLLSSYFGLPYAKPDGTGADSYTVSALPFRAYRLIWNEWYRDQNLQDSVDVPKGPGPDPAGIAQLLLPRGKRKDYFTSALPWPQKGDPVHIPVELSGYLTVYGNPSAPGRPVKTDEDSDGSYRSAFLNEDGEDGFRLRAAGPSGTPTTGNEWTNVLNATTINDLRTAFQIQKLLERDARGGTRYVELIQSHFGVTSPDARLQRPEYLGGATSRITINPVANTAGTDRPEGDLAGYGTTVNEAKFGKAFTEHGIVIGLVSFRADLTYQRGIERMWSRQTRYDFYWPALSHLGEQAVLRKEIQLADLANADEVFGYQERYGEYRYKPSRVTGLFNSDAPASLDVWHLAQDFEQGSEVLLNPDFIYETPPIDRCVAVPDEPYFLADFWFDFKCTRPMPMYAVPGLVDHF